MDLYLIFISIILIIVIVISWQITIDRREDYEDQDNYNILDHKHDSEHSDSM